MVPRHKIDIAVADLLFALLACLRARSPAPDERVVLDELGLANKGIVCLSVRSGFDLMLEALRPPKGSEFIVSAVTHLDIARILEWHGVVPVPVDLDTTTLAPRRDLLERALNERTRGIVIAHLFGGTTDLSPVAAVAREHDLLLVEDCAQSLGAGPPGGDPLADVSMFSFGPIKTATALGGAVLRVEDQALLAGMRDLQAGRPLQKRSAYARRVARFLALALLAHPAAYGVLARMVDLDRLVTGSVRGFSGNHEALLEQLRVRPSGPLIALLARRLGHFDRARIRARSRAGDEVGALLSPRFRQPGAEAETRTHWVFPVVPPDPQELVTALRSAGFDAARGTSSIGVVPAPAGRPELEAEEARELMRRVVFLPTYPELGAVKLLQLAEAANASLVEAEAPELTVPAH
jgi:perosamine synthetase